MTLRYVLSKQRVYLEIRPGSKAPAAQGWSDPKYRGINPDEYERVGMRCDDLVVVDCDSEEAIQRWLTIHPNAVPTVKTPRGAHFYYEAFPGSPEGPMVGVFSGIDIRAGHKSQVLCKGDGYERLDPDDVYRYFNPSWLIGSVEEGNPDVDYFAEGTRNESLFRLGATLRGEGHDEEEIFNALMGMNNTHCKPPLEVAEVRAIVRSVIKYEPDPTELIPVSKAAFEDLIGGADLDELELPEPRWVLHDVLPEGLTLFAARPKMGKSWLVLNLAVAVTHGVPFLDQPTTEGSVLYLALEDNQRRLQKRYRKACRSAGLLPTNRATFTTRASKLPAVADQMRNYVEANPDTRLIIVDTLARVKQPRKPQAGVYEDEYNALTSIKELADDHQLAIVVIHHTNQAQGLSDVLDAVSGSTGLTGGADNVLLLEKKREGKLFHGRGRDLETDPEIWVDFDHDAGWWHRVEIQVVDSYAEMLTWCESHLNPGDRIPNVKEWRKLLPHLSQAQIDAGKAQLDALGTSRNSRKALTWENGLSS